MPSHLGIDIGGTSIKMALWEDGAISASAASAPYARPTREELVLALRSALKTLSPRKRFQSLGLCLPGRYDADREVITQSANLPSLANLPLRPLLTEALEIDVRELQVLSDAEAAARDFYESEHRPQGRFLAISLGTGVGACVLDNGVPLRVSGASPGHFGQLDVTIHEPDRDPPLGPDGGRGGLEGYVGLPALVQRLRCTPDTLIACLRRDPVPLQALGRAIRIAHAIYRPARVRLLGGVGIRLGPLVPEIREMVARDLTSVAREGWTLGCGTSQFHAANGAARVAAAGWEGRAS